MPIVFISALIGILQHIKVLPIIVKSIGLALSKVNGMGKLESYNAVASAILGQSEVFISVKQLGLLPEKRMYTLYASAMSTVSMSIVGSYMVLLKPQYVCNRFECLTYSVVSSLLLSLTHMKLLRKKIC